MVADIASSNDGGSIIHHINLVVPAVIDPARIGNEINKACVAMGKRIEHTHSILRVGIEAGSTGVTARQGNIIHQLGECNARGEGRATTPDDGKPGLARMHNRLLLEELANTRVQVIRECR